MATLRALHVPLIAGVVGVAVLVGSIAIITAQYYREIRAGTEAVRQAREVIETSYILLVQYIDPTASPASVAATFEKLEALVAGDRVQARSVAQLGEALEGNGDVRGRIEAVIQHERQLLLARRGRVDRVQLFAVVLAAVSTALAALLFGAALLFFAREMARRRERYARALALRKKADDTYRDRERFLATAAHDLRQPLHLVRMALAAIEGTEPGHSKGLLGPVRHGVDMLDRTLEQLIDVRRLTMETWTPHLEPIDVPALFRTLEQAYGALALAGGLEFRTRAPQLHVMADKGMTERILSNLLLNAIKYTASGGLLLGARRRGDNVLFQVWDTGVGIRDEDREPIFREFGRAAGPQQVGGLGLGLFVSRKLARKLGTDLSVKSQPGRGSCFSFALPRAR